jgi:ATP-dependent Clp protease protease subunit
MLKLLASNKAKGSFKIEAKTDANEATIYLYDMIVSTDDEAEWWGGVSPQAFVKALNEITAPTIHLRVNSPGGSVFAARAMEQAIRQHTSKVIAHVDGLAASAASFLIMAADEIRMAPGSFLMIHKAWTGMWGNADDLRKEADLLDQIDGSFVKTYATRSGQTPEDITAWMAAETWIEADRAVELGFATAVDSEKAASNSAPTPGNWDTSVFKNAPKVDESVTKPHEPGVDPDNAAKEAARIAAAAAMAEIAASIAKAKNDEHEERRRAVLKALIPA